MLLISEIEDRVPEKRGEGRKYDQEVGSKGSIVCIEYCNSL